MLCLLIKSLDKQSNNFSNLLIPIAYTQQISTKSPNESQTSNNLCKKKTKSSTQTTIQTHAFKTTSASKCQKRRKRFGTSFNLTNST